MAVLKMPWEAWRKIADTTSSYGYAAQAQPTGGHPCLSLLIAIALRRSTATGLPGQDARRSAGCSGLSLAFQDWVATGKS